MKKVLFLALVLCLMAGTAVAADTIKICLMAPLTGAWASEGQDMQQIVELLADEINAAGGINGQQIEILTEDDGGDPRDALATGAHALVTRSRSVAGFHAGQPGLQQHDLPWDRWYYLLVSANQEPAQRRARARRQRRPHRSPR